MDRITYKSENGFSGMLYGRSSLVIMDPDGREVLHTGFRMANTLEELKGLVDSMPDFLRLLMEGYNENR